LAGNNQLDPLVNVRELVLQPFIFVTLKEFNAVVVQLGLAKILVSGNNFL
jgi:hypothetical protein